jgi:hypothetical protein
MACHWQPFVLPTSDHAVQESLQAAADSDLTSMSGSSCTVAWPYDVQQMLQQQPQAAASN